MRARPFLLVAVVAVVAVATPFSQVQAEEERAEEERARAVARLAARLVERLVARLLVVRLLASQRAKSVQPERMMDLMVPRSKRHQRKAPRRKRS